MAVALSALALDRTQIPAPSVLLMAQAPIGAAQAPIGDADLERASNGRSVALGQLSAGGRVTVVPLEVYVARVLAGEGEPGAPDGAQEALAVAIRTFAIFNAGRHRRDGFDLCDTTHCQVLRAATASTRRAALATAGRILTYNGAVAEVFYSASCGGRTENASDVWPAANLPYLRSVVDDVHEDDVPWTFAVTLRDVQRALAKAGFVGRLKDVRVDARSGSDRVSRLRLTGLEPNVVTGDQFRRAIGARDLKSTAFTFTRHGETLRFTGRGYGHGVGLCVIGAGRRARRGESFETILGTYYPGLDVTRLERATVDTARTQGRPAAAAAASRPDVPATTGRAAVASVSSGIIARVPLGLSVTAAEVEQMAVRARDAVTRALGTSLAPITIDVHESLETFRAATGQPWWVSAVVQGTTIDLLPPAVLAQRDGVEAALRVAIAELLVSPDLKGRPVWVKVGAARYFARLTPLPPPAAAVRCPADAELTLAISAAAQREAESRAESCFARAYARTKDWRGVK
jgi:SpoIID/LytB domain protein